MKVNDFIINTDQQSAGCAAMTGVFTAADVRTALLAAGVPYSINDSLPASMRRVSDKWFVWEVANRLCQRERKKGRIKSIKGRKWEAVL